MSPSLCLLIRVNRAVLVLVKSEVHSMTGDCGPVHNQLNFPSPLTVQERVRLELTSSDERVTLAAGGIKDCSGKSNSKIV